MQETDWLYFGEALRFDIAAVVSISLTLEIMKKGNRIMNQTEVTSVKLVFSKYVMSFEILTKVD